MTWQLVIHKEPDVLDLAVVAVGVGRGRTGEIRRANHLTEARDFIDTLCADSCDLVVVGSSTPADAAGEWETPGREPTKKFILELKKRNPEVRIVVLSTVPDEFLVGFLDAMTNTSLLTFDTDWRDALIRKAAPPSVNAPDFLELQIEIKNSKEGRWWMQRHGNMDYKDDGILPLEERLFERIKEVSAELDGDIQGRNWRSAMKRIAQDLEEMLFDNNNRQFWRKFTENRLKAGGLERTWVRFNVNPDTEMCFVEALKELNDVEHWMLTTPIFRKYPPPSRRLPLFKDAASRQADVNCLIIEADEIGGIVTLDNKKEMLAPLPMVRAEAQLVTDVLRKAAADAKGIGAVELLRVSELLERGVDPLQEVMRVMRTRSWHVVHFAGHAIQSGSSTAALVLSADRGSLLTVDDLCKHVGHTQFMFLSCCRSAESSLIMKLAEQSIPAILGFRWRVNDGGAANFAREFYTELFNRTNSHYKYLEYAFRDARKKLYQCNANDPTWASPMLVLQMDQAQAC